MSDELPPFFSTADAAHIMGVNVTTVRSRIRRGELEAVRVGKLWRVTGPSLREYMRREEGVEEW